MSRSLPSWVLSRIQEEERLMKSKNTTRRLRPRARSLVDCLREFLTPALRKQAHERRHCQRRRSRWGAQPLILVLLLMTWCCGDSQPERFETARAFCVALLPKRRRPGRTAQGFQKALAQLPARTLRVLAAGVRMALAARLAGRWSDGGFVAIGCDGSRLECPRSAELACRLLRMSSNVTLYTRRRVKLGRYREGLVYHFPAQDKKQQPPLRLRLIRVRARKKKNDVWLLTDVLDRRRLSAASAAAFYRRRWES